MATLEEELNNMEEGLRRLKIEYHVFLNGNRKKPPEDLRIKLERLSKQLSERSDMTHAQRFRYTTLLTRYYTYRGLWRRLLQERERGKEEKSEPPPSIAPPDKVPSAEVFRISLSDPETEKEKVKKLYNALLSFKTGAAKEPMIPYPQFAKYIASQTRVLRNKHRCASVAYIITLEGGAVRFTAAAENPESVN